MERRRKTKHSSGYLQRTKTRKDWKEVLHSLQITAWRSVQQLSIFGKDGCVVYYWALPRFTWFTEAKHQKYCRPPLGVDRSQCFGLTPIGVYTMNISTPHTADSYSFPTFSFWCHMCLQWHWNSCESLVVNKNQALSTKDRVPRANSRTRCSILLWHCLKFCLNYCMLYLRTLDRFPAPCMSTPSFIPSLYIASNMNP